MGKAQAIPSGKAERMAFIYRSLSNGIRAAKSLAPREWLAKKGLSIEATGASFNSGQMHHRKEPEYKMALAEVGFMQQSVVGSNNDSVPYTVFGIFSIMFPLRNPQNEIVNFYSIRIRSENTAYMNGEPGLYPGYPHEFTKRLYLVNSVLDAATLLESKMLDNRDAVMALHDGEVKTEHEEAIRKLEHLEEIILIDAALPKKEKEKKVWIKEKK